MPAQLSGEAWALGTLDLVDVDVDVNLEVGKDGEVGPGATGRPT
jgi:hypothetical protein